MKRGCMLVLVLLVHALLLRGHSGNESVAPLTIFIVHSEEQDDAKYFSSGEFQDLGYVGPKPTLAAERFSAVRPSVSFDRTVNSISGATEEVPQYGVRIKLLENDRRRFAFLTKRHQGSRFLFQVMDTPVYAPTIRLPITHGWVKIAVESSADAETLAEELRPFVRESDD